MLFNNREIGVFTLKKETYDGLCNFTSTYLTSPYQNFENFLCESVGITAKIPAELTAFLHDFKNRYSNYGALLIHNTPIDKALSAPPTTDVEAEHKTSFLSEMMLLTLAQQLGESFSYIEEKETHIIHNIVPQRKGEHLRANTGSINDFLLHTELAFFDHRPDYLLLLCLRASNSGQSGLTTVAFIDDILDQLDDATQALLRQPIYRVGIPESFGGRKNLTPMMPVMYGKTFDPELRVNFNNMHATTPEGVQALHKLQTLLTLNLQKIFLSPGDLLVIDNKKAVHGRTPFVASYDGTDRWLQRIYVKSTLREMKNLSVKKYLYSFSKSSYSIGKNDEAA